MAVLMRLISLILIVAALMLLGADAVTSLEKGGEITVRSLGTVWAPFNRAGSTVSRPGCSIMPLRGAVRLFLPGAAGLGGDGRLGVILAFIFGRKLGPE